MLRSNTLTRTTRARHSVRSSFVSSRAALLGLALAPVLAFSSGAIAVDWTGAVNSDWNEAGNWAGGALPAGANATVVTNTAGPGVFPVVSVTPTFTPVDLQVGWSAGPARLDHTGGTLATGEGNWFLLGILGSQATYNLANTATTGGSATGFGMGTGSLNVGGSAQNGNLLAGLDAGTVSTINVNTSGTLAAGGIFVGTTGASGAMNVDNGNVSVLGELQIGGSFYGQGAGTSTYKQTGGNVTANIFSMARGSNNAAAMSVTATISGGTLNTRQWFTLGFAGSAANTAVFNNNGGTINVNTNGGGNMELAVFDTTTNTFNANSGNLNVMNSGSIIYGAGGNHTGVSTFNHNGGNVTFYADNGVTVGGTGGVVLGTGGSTGTYIYNLNGGTLTASKIQQGSPGANGTFNFNGGTVKAGADASSFMSGITRAVVKAGGAIIDTNGKNIGVIQKLEHDAAGPAIDGGLTKNGAGVMTLGGGVSTYTGDTVINAGTLRLASGGPPQAIGKYSFDELASGSLAQGQVVANSGTGGAALNGAANHADNFLDPTNGTASIVGGHIGNGLSLDSFGSSVDIASNVVEQSGSGSWTFSSWINTTTPGSAIVSKDDGNASWSSGDSVFYLGSTQVDGVISPGNLPTAVRNAGGFMQGDPATTNLTDGAWHMVTFVSTAGVKSIYVDGVAVAMTLTDFNLGDNSVLTRLGFNSDTLSGVDGNANFAGIMDELQFFDVALNATQIQSLFTNNAVTTGVGSQQFLPLASAVRLTTSGAALDLNDNNQTIGSLSGVAGTSVVLGTATLITGGNNTSTTFAGVISGNGGVEKAGTGTMTLTGANTYSGGTAVSAGTLVLAPAAQAVVFSGPTPAGIDVKGGKVAFGYSAPAAGTALASNVLAVLDAGYDQPSKFSSGTIRSTTLAGGRVLGWINDTANNQVVVAYTLPGDADLNFAVNFNDLLSLAQNYGPTSGKVWSQGDFDYNGGVNFNDLLLLAQNYNQSLSALQASQLGESFSADYALALSLVPEPTLLSTLAFAAGACLRRKRKA
jgi:fibronectin-binding autotransporter adhesin